MAIQALQIAGFASLIENRGGYLFKKLWLFRMGLFWCRKIGFNFEDFPRGDRDDMKRKAKVLSFQLR